jgi:hypothetical protein
MRFVMPSGQFTAPIGTDCYQNIYAFHFMAWTAVCLCIGLSIVVAIDFRAKKGPLLKILSLLLGLVCFTGCILMFVSMYRPNLSRAIYAAVQVFSVLFNLTFLAKQVHVRLNLMNGMSGNRSKIEILGGPWVVALLVSFVASSLLPIIGAIGCAATFSHGDASVAFQMWQLHAAGFTIYTFFLVAVIETLLRTFLRIVEDANKAAPIAKTKGETTPIDDLIFRFKRTRLLMPFSLVQAVFYIASVIAFPFFSYFVVLNLLTTWFVCAVMWFSVTAHGQREYYFGALLRVSRKYGPSRLSSKSQHRETTRMGSKKMTSQKHTSKQDSSYRTEESGQFGRVASSGGISPIIIQIKGESFRKAKKAKEEEFEEYTPSANNPLFNGENGGAIFSLVKEEAIRKVKQESTLSAQ